MAKAMRESFSRSQSQSTEDSDLAKAESRFNVDNKSWVLPSSESEYREGIKFLNNYLLRLTDSTQSGTQFYARADNLRYWLSTVETRLGSLSQRLSASVGQRRLNTDLAGEAGATQSTQTATEVVVKTPWRKIDDVFFEARGSSWAILHFLKAIEVDFADVLERKNARVSLQQIIRELEATQESVYSPMILNGSGFGMWANHSLVMASYISRANAALIDLRELLAQG
jgi:DNA phosphorothioation-dependent restriction protein DptG